jgi:hypothetical protein
MSTQCYHFEVLKDMSRYKYRLLLLKFLVYPGVKAVFDSPPPKLIRSVFRLLVTMNRRPRTALPFLEDGHIQLWKVSSATFVDIGQVYVKVKIRTPGELSLGHQRNHCEFCRIDPSRI